jgi:two-component system response regulator YesN
MVISEAERVKPIIMEQFLREYILGMGDTYEVFNIYCKTFGVDSLLETRMIIIKPSESCDYEDLFFVKNTAEQYIGNENILLSTTFNDHLFIITEILERNEIVDLLDKIRKTIYQCYSYNIMAVYSKVSYISDAPSAYERLKQCMGYSFYSDSDAALYENDIKIGEGNPTISPEYGAIEHAVHGGDREKVKMLLNGFFKTIEKAMPTPAVAKTYCLELYVCIIRCCSVEKIDRYMKGIVSVQEAKTLKQIKSFIQEKGLEITAANAPESNRIYSSLIRDTINIIDENIENENLSLRWLAGTILYTNVDYLGKLFKKETGKNFSHYVMEKRMEMAKDLILEGKKDRIYEVAEKVGYGSNSQYFSQVFKKYTGVSPLEYKEFARLAREKMVDPKNT